MYCVIENESHHNLPHESGLNLYNSGGKLKVTAFNMYVACGLYSVVLLVFYVQCLFLHSPAGQSLDVKKSSHKKLTKFLGVLQKRGLVKVKELSKGVESIISVDRDHPE